MSRVGRSSVPIRNSWVYGWTGDRRAADRGPAPLDELVLRRRDIREGETRSDRHPHCGGLGACLAGAGDRDRHRLRARTDGIRRATLVVPSSRHALRMVWREVSE